MGTSTTASSLSSSLRDLYVEESARIQHDFEANGDGRAVVARRTRLIDQIAQRLWQELVSPDLQATPIACDPHFAMRAVCHAACGQVLC